MNNDDESLSTPTPDEFVISTYRENPLAAVNSKGMSDSSKIVFLYKCVLCRTFYENATFTCSKCVNSGGFCSVTHNSRPTREVLLGMLTTEDNEEFQKHFNGKVKPWTCHHRIFMLEKFKSQKTTLQLEYEKKSESFTKRRLLAEQIQSRKNRFRSVHHSIEKLREQIKQKKESNRDIQHHIDEMHKRIRTVKRKLPDLKTYIPLSDTKRKEMINQRSVWEEKLLIIRQRRMKELIVHVFPIQHVLKADDELARRIKALEKAVVVIDDEINTEQIEMNDSPEVVDDRYQIVNSSLPSDGNYRIENLVSIYNDESFRDNDSFQASPSCDSYKTLSALSHACQLINIVSVYLNVKLPFYLHPMSFSHDELLVDHLRADIAKLNANIVIACLSQGISIEPTNVTHTLENLLKLFTFQKYVARPQEILDPDGFIAMLKKEVTDINRALTTSYWFDDDDDNDNIKQSTDVAYDENEYEIVPQDELIPDGSLTAQQQSDSTLATSGQQQSTLVTSGQQQQSLIASTFGFLRNALVGNNRN